MNRITIRPKSAEPNGGTLEARFLLKDESWLVDKVPIPAATDFQVQSCILCTRVDRQTETCSQMEQIKNPKQLFDANGRLVLVQGRLGLTTWAGLTADNNSLANDGVYNWYPNSER